MTDWTLFPLDCRDAMRLCMAPDSVDSIVTDPPYDLTSIVKRFGGANAAPAQYGTDGAYARASGGFMGQIWDSTGVAFDPAMWREAYRVLKPGGHLLAMGGTRTYHRLVTAIEDAGFEIRDTLSWIYGSGFPKSHNVSKGIDKLLGAFNQTKFSDVTAPATPQAQQWDGWGTAVKPATELICLARKPLSEKSVAANVLRWGTGALNIDASRIPYAGDADERETKSKNAHGDLESGPMSNQIYGTYVRDRDNYDPPGRFPANVLHDGSPDVLANFPDTKSIGHHPKARGIGGIGNDGQAELIERSEQESGSAARFFYCAKASRADREEGLDALPLQAAGMVSDHSGAHITRREEGYEPPQRANHHPTVKPSRLMRYLVRLVTPAGGTVFDPFAGSGSTGKAALLEGFSFIGCEMTAEYVPIAEARLAHALASYRRDKPCEYCDGTGDVNSIDGRWLGGCDCGARGIDRPVTPGYDATG